MTECLHDPRPIQDALAPHAKRLREYRCASCGTAPEIDDDAFDLYVLPMTNGVHSTPQLSPLCDDCASQVAEALAEMQTP